VVQRGVLMARTAAALKAGNTAWQAGASGGKQATSATKPKVAGQAIPKILHFIYVGGRPFSFIHFLAIFSAWKINQPDVIYLHHTEEPTGEWWTLLRPLVKLNRVAPVTQIHGNPVQYPAHQADVIRLEMLRRHGGIYLDLDVISINPFDPLLRNSVVMGIEPGTGLCNAVILAQPDASFIVRWQGEYHSFNGQLWNYHSVVLPGELARKSPTLIKLAGKYDFFYPTHNDPACGYLWGVPPSLTSLAMRMGKNLIKMLAMLIKGESDPIKWAYYKTFHGLRGAEWHYHRARQSYCLHLWEGLWGPRYLTQITPKYLQTSNSNFARLMRDVLGPVDIAEIARGRLPT